MATTAEGRCAWLAGEGLQAEAKAAELERQGLSAQAALHHLRAASKLKEAAAICPTESGDKAALEEHAADISARAVYLESLGGMPASLPLEDHIGELSLSLDPSAAKPPDEEQVSALVARAGVTGAQAELSDEGFRLVKALCCQAEMQTYLRRALDSDWRQVRPDAASELEFVACAQRLAGRGGAAGGETTPIEGFGQLREDLRTSCWVELKLGPGQDRLEVAVAMENEARAFEAAGKAQEAVDAYRRAVAVLNLVYSFDPRCKNPKIKDMISSRRVELESLAARLVLNSAGSAPKQGSSDTEVEERLRRLME
ncbi:unnamed protein product [Polarella glacialis]|uniref:Uncharacterized protein n=1 Tax=Polarella glacialis TaxID=89957 RepID=A0A813DLB1_POLGL|nr:unnamed protein product [Polarella glacialis]